MDKHDMIAAAKNLALELGRTPTKAEFCNAVKGGTYQIAKQFGQYAAMLQAAGLETYSERRGGLAEKPRRIDSSIFLKDIDAHLEKYEQREVMKPQTPYPTAAIISDIHWPFESKRVLDAFFAYVEKEQPEWVIINGDAWDRYSHSRYPRSMNVFTPREEERLSREKNEAFWKEVQRRSPKSKCVQMLGNHCVRPMKQVLEHYPEIEDWVAEKMKKDFTFDGVQTIFDPREELYLREDIIVFHGYRSKLGDHANYTLLSCINGHTHRGGVVWKKIRGSVIFEMNSGVAGDPESKGLTYTPQKINEWTPGFGVINQYGPQFVPC